MSNFLIKCMAALFPILAYAAPCDFQVEGDPRNGLQFLAQARIPELGVQSALGQLRQLAVEGGYQVGNALITGNTGELSFVQDGNQPPIVIRAIADDSGRVSLSLKLARGQKANPADVETEFCGMLGKLKGGKEGETLAAVSRKKAGPERITEADAVKLSKELGKEVKAALAPVSSKGNLSRMLIGTGTSATPREFTEAFAPIRAKYLGCKYTIDGQIHLITRGHTGREMEIDYLVTPTRGLLGIRQEVSYNNLNFQIKCLFAKGQERFFATLSEGDSVKLTGIVSDIGPGAIQLSECERAN